MIVEEIKELEGGSGMYELHDIEREEFRICFKEGIKALRASDSPQTLLDFQAAERITQRVFAVGIVSILERQIKNEQQ